jgi:4-amino-4-deoxy-L-arabinose transferase-like glycosyltransferase
MAALFSAALLLCCGPRPRQVAAAVALGLAALTKGLVPVVLFLPVLALDFRRWLRPLPWLVFGLIAVPWFWLENVRSGGDLVRVLFLQQTFSRFSSSALQHVQPWWFYVPVALLLLFPWFPLVPLALRAHGPDARRLAAVALFGFLFFSASLNKLPGYLAPLLPAVCILVALGLSTTRKPGIWLAAPTLALGLLPALAQVVPAALASGLRKSSVPWPALAGGLVAAALVAVAVSRVQRAGFALVAAAALSGLLWLAAVVPPGIDKAASVRPLWRANQPGCIAEQPRSAAYGMYYYARRRLPACGQLDLERQHVVR